jgi:multidrug efflux system membrane fusion protein
MQGPDGAYVYTIKPDDTVTRKNVQVVSTQDGLAVIGNGLAARDRVVVDGQYRLTDGAKISSTNPQQATRDHGRAAPL